jgi:large subunit ribosomal protein L29
MSAKALRAKDRKELQAELIKLRREQFSLRMQAATGATTVKSSEFGKNKRNIARVKTVMTEMARAGAKK